MKKILLVLLALVVSLVFVSSQAFAISKQYQKKGAEVVQGGKEASPHLEPAQKQEAGYEKGDFHKKVTVADFPANGWHKGPYVAVTVGMMQVTNDTHVVTDQKFDSSIDPAFGIAFGWDIADWIGPILQISFGTATGSIGDANNAAAITNYPSGDYPQYNFPIGTFPVENARQYALDFTLAAKATLPYFVRAEWQPKMVKIIPFAKLGVTGHGMFTNAPTNANKIGAFGGGPAIGLGCEFLIWKGFFVALDATEHLIFQSSFSKSINTTIGAQTLKLTKGGFTPHFTLNGMFGWHF